MAVYWQNSHEAVAPQAGSKARPRRFIVQELRWPHDSPVLKTEVFSKRTHGIRLSPHTIRDVTSAAQRVLAREGTAVDVSPEVLDQIGESAKLWQERKRPYHIGLSVDHTTQPPSVKSLVMGDMRPTFSRI